MDTKINTVLNLFCALNKDEQKQTVKRLLWRYSRELYARAFSLSSKNNLESNNQERDYSARENEEFKVAFPDKSATYQGDFGQFDVPALIAEVRKSDFLTANNNLGLSWLLDHYADVMAGKYRNFVRQTEPPAKRPETQQPRNPFLSLAVKSGNQ